MLGSGLTHIILFILLRINKYKAEILVYAFLSRMDIAVNSISSSSLAKIHHIFLDVSLLLIFTQIFPVVRLFDFAATILYGEIFDHLENLFEESEEERIK